MAFWIVLAAVGYLACGAVFLAVATRLDPDLPVDDRFFAGFLMLMWPYIVACVPLVLIMWPIFAGFGWIGERLTRHGRST